jgi:hypothetical protein
MTSGSFQFHPAAAPDYRTAKSTNSLNVAHSVTAHAAAQIFGDAMLQVSPEIVGSAAIETTHVLHRDYETRSLVALKSVGVNQYAADPSTKVICVAFAVDDDPVQLWRPGSAGRVHTSWT